MKENWADDVLGVGEAEVGSRAMCNLIKQIQELELDEVLDEE